MLNTATGWLAYYEGVGRRYVYLDMRMESTILRLNFCFRCPPCLRMVLLFLGLNSTSLPFLLLCHLPYFFPSLYTPRVPYTSPKTALKLFLPHSSLLSPPLMSLISPHFRLFVTLTYEELRAKATVRRCHSERRSDLWDP